MDLPDLVSERDNGYPAWKRTAFLVGGGVCVVLGVIGWLMPVVTGIPFYVAGFVLFGLASVRMARTINALDRKLPDRVRRALRRAFPNSSAS
jgi:uncharacterized membrane protein YbaN (DUF454 family)